MLVVVERSKLAAAFVRRKSLIFNGCNFRYSLMAAADLFQVAFVAHMDYVGLKKVLAVEIGNCLVLKFLLMLSQRRKMLILSKAV